MTIFRLSETIAFPPPHLADSDGLLAVGGDLSVKRLLTAYRMGIFPWYAEEEPILWWSPDPRLVLYPHEIRISRSLSKLMRKGTFRVTMDTAFERVIRECAGVRSEKFEETWLVEEMIEAYIRLHGAGFAHSVEAWHGDELVGGLYGVSIGKAFFGESMFTRRSNASKVAFAGLTAFLLQRNYAMVDCQVKTDHLMSMGAREVPRKLFLAQLERALSSPTKRGPWCFDAPLPTT